MNLRRAAATRPPIYPRNEERTQRAHELRRALDSTKVLAERLELALLEDHRQLVLSIAGDLQVRLAEVERSADEG